MAKSEADELRAFVKANPQRNVTCWVCSLPNADALNEVMRDGARAGVIRSYLISKGADPKEATPRRVQYHIAQGHHLKAAR